MNARIALCTAPSTETARTLVNQLVEEGLAACGNIIPDITSIYRWQGAIEESAEALIVFKTTQQNWPRLMERVTQLHPYSVPELLLLPVEAGSTPYLEWLEENTSLVNP